MSAYLSNLNALDPLDMALALVLSAVAGGLIFLVYRYSFSGVMYSASFGTALVALTLITTVLMLAVTSNVILSLGMVGALSIVRFRTAIKDPMEIIFLFWAIETGIVFAAELLLLGLAGNFVVAVVLLLVNRRMGHRNSYILIVQCNGTEGIEKAEKAARDVLGERHVKFKTLSPLAQSGGYEGSWEIVLKKKTGKAGNKGNEDGEGSGTEKNRLVRELKRLCDYVAIVSSSGSYTR